jgi:hypothetical protein
MGSGPVGEAVDVVVGAVLADAAFFLTTGFFLVTGIVFMKCLWLWKEGQIYCGIWGGRHAGKKLKGETSHPRDQSSEQRHAHKSSELRMRSTCLAAHYL